MAKIIKFVRTRREDAYTNLAELVDLGKPMEGVLVDSDADAMRGTGYTIRFRTHTGPEAGSCGATGFCRVCAPIACYTCRYFQPSLNCAHKKILEQLISDRGRVMDLDPGMASVNDRTILAVSEVIRRCEERKKELKKARSDG